MKKEIISVTDIEHLAELSALRFNEEEMQRMVGEVSGIIEMLNACAEVKVDNPEEVTVIGLESLRDDESTQNLSRDVVFQNSVSNDSGYFVVPKVVE